tara:strand:- start:1696 stop:2028 length:333 start_codon:yes stop_codon:yes gene_type:complete
MKRFTAFAAALLMTAGAVSAQVTTQVDASIGTSGVAGYPDAVVGANGVTYACAPATTIDGLLARRCIRPGAAGFDAMSPAAIGAAAAVVVAVGLIANNDDDTTTTTTTTR